MSIPWNQIFYIDCLSPEGLPSLPSNSVHECFTDPPYNVNYKGKKKRSDEVKYSDNKTHDDYKEWCLEWFTELKRICSGSIYIHCGFTNLKMWINEIEFPFGILYHYKEDVQTGSSISHLEKLTPILVYRKPSKRFKINPIKIPNRKDLTRGTYKHSCPTNKGLIMEILKRQQPLTVIDPFMGSGSTAFCCQVLNIKYIGYEIDKTVKTDYFKNKAQLNIGVWMK